MNILKMKLVSNLNERLKLRETEHNKLLQRYQNVKKENENQQNIERIKLEKTMATYSAKIGYAKRPGTAQQRSIMASQMSKMGSSRMGSSTMRSSNKNASPKTSRKVGSNMNSQMKPASSPSKSQ